MFIIFLKSEFWNQNSNFLIFQERNSKKKLIGIFGIKNRIGIPIQWGVPEIGTKNWNSQPSLALCICYLCKSKRVYFVLFFVICKHKILIIMFVSV
jgi:hypothetical protein